MTVAGKQVYVVHIEHPVLDYERWKAVFDGDPAGRAQAGVRHYRVLRGVDESNLVMIDLDFETEAEARAMLVSLQALWGRVDGVLITGPQGRVLEVAESVEL